MDLEDVYFQTHISCRFLARLLVLVEDASHMCPYFDCTPCLPTSDISLVVFRMFMLHPWLACLQWVHPNLTGTTIYRKHQETSGNIRTDSDSTSKNHGFPWLWSKISQAGCGSLISSLGPSFKSAEPPTNQHFRRPRHIIGPPFGSILVMVFLGDITKCEEQG